MSYMFFVTSNYESLRKAVESAGTGGKIVTEVGKLAGARWRALTDDERKQWKTKAEEDRAKHPEKYAKRKKEKKAAPAEGEKKPAKKRAKKGGEVAVATA